MHDELMIHGNNLYTKTEKNPNSVFLKIRLPWYRGLPLSDLGQLEFTFDGKPVPRESTRLMINGVPYSMDGIRELSDTTWFVLDTQEVEVTLDAPLKEGKHDVSLLMKLRIPYYKSEQDPSVDNFAQYASCSKKMKFERSDD